MPKQKATSDPNGLLVTSSMVKPSTASTSMPATTVVTTTSGSPAASSLLPSPEQQAEEDAAAEKACQKIDVDSFPLPSDITTGMREQQWKRKVEQNKRGEANMRGIW